jgi:hypothetical protein
MVKADLSRNYYADLDLPPTADINDIKKQFRKLGRQLLLAAPQSKILTVPQLSNGIQIATLAARPK